MKKYLLLALTALIVSCTGKTATDKETSNDVANADTLQEVAAQTSGEESGRAGYTFKTSFHKDENGQCDALILTCQSGEKSQQFTCKFNWAKDEDLLGEAGEITEEDINFDGIPDVMVCLGDFGVNPELFPTVFYGACLWNAEAQSFEQVKEFEGISNPEIDAQSKTIASEYSTPVGDVFQEVYAWKGGKLELTESTSQNEFGDEE